MATRAFPPGNARGAEVFQVLLQKSRDGMYDETFFALVEQYRQMYPLSQKGRLQGSAQSHAIFLLGNHIRQSLCCCRIYIPVVGCNGNGPLHAPLAGV